MFLRRQNRSASRLSPHRKRRRRDSHGLYIVEALVALVISSIVAFSLLNMVAGAMRAGGRIGTEAYATEIMDELCEQTRSADYERLKNFVGQTKTLLVNKTTSSSAGYEFSKRPLLLDLWGKQWQPKTVSNVTQAFNGSATYSVSDGPEVGTLTATIELSWTDSYGQVPRTLKRSIVVLEVPEGVLP